MIKHSLWYLASLLMFVQCAQQDKQMPMNAIDTSDFDTSVQPGENFYQYATGGWQKNNPLTPEYSRYGSFDILQENNNEQVRDLINDLAEGRYPDNPLANKIGRFYAMGMDSNTIDQQGSTPLTPYLEKIDRLQDKSQLIDLIVDYHKMGVYPFFAMAGSPDRKNSDWVIINLYQGGLGMNDRDYYLETDNRTKEIQQAYKKYIAQVLELSGYGAGEPTAMAEQIFEFEKGLAHHSMTRLQRRDPELTYNKSNLDSIASQMPNLAWERYFNLTGIDATDQINVNQPDYFKYLNQTFEETALQTLKHYLAWQFINASAPYLSTDHVNARFDFYGRTMQGKEKIRPRWKRMVSITNNAMGEALGKIYVEKYFPPADKKRMTDLVENLRETFTERIKHVGWMSDSTKTEAFAKLERMRVKIGYPNKWRDYTSLTLDSAYFLDNVLASERFNVQYEWNKIGKPVDKDEWLMLPHTVNAYYHPLHNEIVFPAGILQPPFYYSDADDAVNYGAIGVVIGHEMTHGFDDKGRKFDKDGNLNDWWTSGDAERFDKQAKTLVEQFNAFIIQDTLRANGELTLGENIADLGGLHIALDALKKTPQYTKNDTIDGFSPTQRFYLAYAKLWAQNIRDEEVQRRIKEDVHSLGEHRVNGPLPNMADFYLAFDITEGQTMYIPVNERAEVW